MADAKKVKDRPAAAATARAREERDSETITVTNAYRNQPVIFHFLGGSLRLGPLESQDISRTCLTSPELAQLVLAGIVTVSEPDSSAAPRRDGEETGRDTSADTVALGSSPSSPDAREA